MIFNISERVTILGTESNLVKERKKEPVCICRTIITVSNVDCSVNVVCTNSVVTNVTNIMLSTVKVEAVISDLSVETDLEKTTGIRRDRTTEKIEVVISSA